MNGFKLVLLGTGVVLLIVGGVILLKKPPRVTLLYQSHRSGSLEHCGCTTYPYGGIDREANAIAEIKKEQPEAVYVDAGNSFAPNDLKGEIEHHRKKARALTEMLNQMELEIFAPGPNEYALGVDFLKKLRQKSKFDYISSNVEEKSGKSLFAPYILKKQGPITLGFISLTPPEKVTSPQLTVVSPEKALKRWLPEVQQKAQLVIVLSQLGSAQDEDLVRRDLTKGIDVIIGADKSMLLEEPFCWFNGRTILVDPDRFGYSLGKLDIDVILPFKGLYSEQSIEKNVESLNGWEKSLADDPNDEIAKRHIENLKKTACLAPVEGGSLYHNQVIKLDKEHFGTPNEITKLIEQFTEQTRQTAIQKRDTNASKKAAVVDTH